MNFHGLDLNLLVAFEALFNECSVTRAASKTGVSQPAMSAALARLRRHFNDPLFIRSASGLTPTARAKELSQPVSRALSQLGEILTGPATFSPDGLAFSFTLGLLEYSMHVLLPEIMQTLAREAPDVRLHIRTYTDRDQPVDLLDAGKIDLAIGIAPTRQESRIYTQPLLTDRFVTVVSRTSEAGRLGMTRARFLAMRHILMSPEGNRYGLMDQQLREQGLQRELQLTLPSMFAIPAIVQQTSLAATLLSRVVDCTAARENICLFPPPFTVPDITFLLLWHRRTGASPAQQWLRALITDAAQAVTTPTP